MKLYTLIIVRPLAKGFMETFGPVSVDGILALVRHADDIANIRVMGINTAYMCKNGAALIHRTK